jgi:cytochrome c556
MKVTLLIIAVAVIAAGFGAGAASAQDKAAVLKQREALMEEQARDAGAVSAYLKGKADQAKATAAAADLTQTMKKIPDLFPPGTGGTSPDGKFATKPAIWSDWNSFLAQRDTAAKKTDALVAAVQGGNKPAIQAAFADLGKNGCGACHGKFRVEIKK